MRQLAPRALALPVTCPARMLAHPAIQTGMVNLQRRALHHFFQLRYLHQRQGPVEVFVCDTKSLVEVVPTSMEGTTVSPGESRSLNKERL